MLHGQRLTMGIRSFSGLFALLALLPTVGSAPFAAQAQEIPLKHCDALPVIEVMVGDQPMLFLVVTAANSMLNIWSCTEVRTPGLQVTSWTGTLPTSAP